MEINRGDDRRDRMMNLQDIIGNKDRQSVFDLVLEEACRQWCAFIPDTPERMDGEGFAEFFYEIFEQKQEEYIQEMKEAESVTNPEITEVTGQEEYQGGTSFAVKGSESRTASVPLREQENLKELLGILEEHGLEKEKSQLIELAGYIDSMDQQFGKVLKELQTVKQQLDKIQEKGIRQSAIKAVTKVEGRVNAAKTQLAVLKARFMDGVNRTLTGLKEKGILAVSKTIDFLGIRQGLTGIKMHLHQSIESADRGILQLANIGDEMHGVKTHLGNIKRELAGKEPQEAGSRNVEKGAVFQVQKLLYGAMEMLEGMEKQTDQTIQRLDLIGEKAEEIRKPSVKENLRLLQEGKKAGGENQLPGKKKEPVR